MNFGLHADILASLCVVLADFAEVERGLIYGSRGRGDYRDHSDIDIAIHAPQLSTVRFGQLWQALEDLPLVYKLDIVHLDALADGPLRERILRDGRPFYLKTPAGAAA